MKSDRIGDAQIDDLVEALVQGTGPHLHDLFAAEGSRAPHVQWSPALSDLSNPLILQFAKSCRAISGGGGPIPGTDFDIAKFDPHLPWMMVLEVEDGGKTFRYSHYGEGIASVRGISMLGRTSADFGGHIGLFFTSAYRAMMQRREWLLTEHAPPKEVFARTWERLMVPVTGADGAITRFVVMNVPDNELRAGLEIIPDPVMVLDAGQIVRYANGAARRLFDRSEFPSQDLTLFQYSGIDLTLAQSPADLVRSRAKHDKVCLAMRNNLLQDFLVTISGARLWGHDFYVITLRMDPRTA